MILDSQTDFLYLSDMLPGKFPEFYNHLIAALGKTNTPYALIPGTKDVWAVDYMPIQIEAKRFVRFRYYPDYLVKYKKWQKTITDTDAVCVALNIETEKSDIIIDGGNVIRGNDVVIMTDKVFQENPHYTEQALLSTLETIFQARIIIIPREKNDWIGHADGLVRFYQNDTVLINDFSRENTPFAAELKTAIGNAGLKYIEIPYDPYSNSHPDDACGLYINFLEMEKKLFLPVFNIESDDKALRLFEDLYRGYTIIPVTSNEIAKEYGVLNCISWNIQQ